MLVVQDLKPTCLIVATTLMIIREADVTAWMTLEQSVHIAAVGIFSKAMKHLNSEQLEKLSMNITEYFGQCQKPKTLFK